MGMDSLVSKAFLKVCARSGSLGFYFCGYGCFSPSKKYTLVILIRTSKS